jgi:menaquinone-dependent protoporphyrinogen oxidase
VSVLVAYASKHGATGAIAERIADVLRERGVPAEARAINAVTTPADYDAFVIGSAAYGGSWVTDAISFIERNQSLLANCPVWLFSSGLLGGQPTDPAGRDLRNIRVPRDLARIATATHVRDHRLLPGARNHQKLDVCDLMVWGLPRNRRLLIEGDFRDWPEVESWAAGIADKLAAEEVARHDSPTTRPTRWNAVG